MSQELQDYIAQARKVGKSDEEIVKELLDKGWKHNLITKALSQIRVLSNPEAPTPSSKHNKVGRIGQLALVVLGISFYIVFLLLIAVLNVFVMILGNSIWNDEKIIFLLSVFVGLPVLLLILTGISVVYKGELAPFGFLSSEKVKKPLNNIGWIIIGAPPVIFIIRVVTDFIERLS